MARAMRSAPMPTTPSSTCRNIYCIAEASRSASSTALNSPMTARRSTRERPALSSGSAPPLPSRQLAVGAEFRTKPDNLKFAKEGHAFDVFLAYFFNKNVSATLAFVALGDIATQRNQNGVYASLQVGF